MWWCVGVVVCGVCGVSRVVIVVVCGGGNQTQKLPMERGLVCRRTRGGGGCAPWVFSFRTDNVSSFP